MAAAAAAAAAKSAENQTTKENEEKKKVRSNSTQEKHRDLRREKGIVISERRWERGRRARYKQGESLPLSGEKKYRKKRKKGKTKKYYKKNKYT